MRTRHKLIHSNSICEVSKQAKLNSYLRCLSNCQSYKEVQGDNCHRSQDGIHFRGGSYNVLFPVLGGVFMGLEL